MMDWITSVDWRALHARLRGGAMLAAGVVLLGIVLLMNGAKFGLLVWATSVVAVGVYVSYWAGRTIIRRRMSAVGAEERPALMIARALITIGVLIAMALVAGCSADSAPAEHRGGRPVTSTDTVATPASLDWRMRRDLATELKNAWGVTGSNWLSLSAAQISQESGWHPQAASRYAMGLAQFTPSTSAWIARRYRAELWPADPWNAQWAITAMALYDRDLFRPLTWARDSCARWAFTLSAYNGGLGWLRKDRAQCRQNSCNDLQWFGEAEGFSSRSQAAMRENRHYVSHILRALTPQYVAAGYGGQNICAGA